MGNKYILKHDEKGNLYKYVEFDKYGKILSYFKTEGNKLIRFNKSSKTKQLIQFKTEVMLKQTFIAGESFINVFDVEKEECIQYNMLEIEKKITLIKNEVSEYNLGKYIIDKHEQIKSNKNSFKNNKF